LAVLRRKLIKPQRRLLMVYPNSGETWDGKAKAWKAGSGVGSDPEAFAALAERWVAAGATVVGGCCRTTPATIAALRRRLVVVDEERKGGGGGGL
jgi:homocysteine S-methyltransferase